MDDLVSEPPRPQEPAEESATKLPEGLYYDLARQEVAHILEAIRKDEGYNVEALRGLTNGMVQALAAGDGLMIRAMEGTATQPDLPRHMVNVAILAVKIGLGMGCREDELPWLALSACLHDVGMVIVPPEILNKPAALSPAEFTLIRQHPERGFRILQRLGQEFEGLAYVALQEHERLDGSGYPKGLKGEAIHEYAQIVGLADIYEAMTHPRPYRQKRMPADVVKELIGSERSRFPNRLLKGFLRGLSAFPVGSVVRLNSTEVARVVAISPNYPLRPVVEIIQGPKGEKLEPPRRMDLSTNTLLYITGTVAGLGGKEGPPPR